MRVAKRFTFSGKKRSPQIARISAEKLFCENLRNLRDKIFNKIIFDLPVCENLRNLREKILSGIIFDLPVFGNLPNLREKYLKCLVLLAVIVLPSIASAHTGIDMSNFSRTDVATLYLKLGFDHILPLGLDHILFILSLYLLNPKLKPILFQATVFTVAHSVTLGLAMYGYISQPGHIVEPIIALSIMFVALENVLTDKLRPARIVIVFIFGLIHGMGFASVLTDLGLPEKQFVNALIAFNVGVELGQITVILIAWALVGYWFGKKKWYRQRIVIPASLVIAAIALYWTIERAFFSV